jgi:ABC-type phosphonate transport system ATPase subunit
MLIIWSALLGVLLFLGIVVVTLLFGVAANKAEKEIIERTEAEQRAGLTGDITSDPAHPIHRRYVEA